MLLYLATNTHPDIAFAVSQVARFNHTPKQSCATAIKTIVHFLDRTSDKGTIVCPPGKLQLDCSRLDNFQHHSCKNNGKQQIIT
jgi:hypothetical protein